MVRVLERISNLKIKGEAASSDEISMGLLKGANLKVFAQIQGAVSRSDGTAAVSVVAKQPPLRDV